MSSEFSESSESGSESCDHESAESSEFNESSVSAEFSESMTPESCCVLGM